MSFKEDIQAQQELAERAATAQRWKEGMELTRQLPINKAEYAADYMLGHNRPDYKGAFWDIPEGPSTMGREGIDRSRDLENDSRLQRATGFTDYARMLQDRARAQQVRSLGWMDDSAMGRNGSVAHMQAQAQQEAALRQAGRVGSLAQARQSQQGLNQQQAALASQAIGDVSSERMQAQSAYAQALGGLRGQDLARMGMEGQSDAAQNQFNLAQEALAQGWGKYGIAEKSARYKALQDYEKFNQAQLKNEADMSLSAYLGTLDNSPGFNYGGLFEGLGGAFGGVARAMG